MTGIERSRRYGDSWRTGHNDNGKEHAALTMVRIGVNSVVGEMTQ